jgi:hypothetical protein
MICQLAHQRAIQYLYSQEVTDIWAYAVRRLRLCRLIVTHGRAVGTLALDCGQMIYNGALLPVPG